MYTHYNMYDKLDVHPRDYSDQIVTSEGLKGKERSPGCCISARVRLARSMGSLAIGTLETTIFRREGKHFVLYACINKSL